MYRLPLFVAIEGAISAKRVNQQPAKIAGQYLESQIVIAAHPSRRPLRAPPHGKAFIPGMRFNLLKHNNLMLRSERRERLEAWAASDSPILDTSHAVLCAQNGVVVNRAFGLLT
jgi:hypothetical protein